MKRLLVVMLSLMCVANIAHAQSFKELVGDVEVGDVQTPNGVTQVPYITWGGDVATFYANGGPTTQKGTIFANQGLSLNLVPGDDSVQQVKDYLSGKSPYLRMTMRMLGAASEVLNENPKTKPVVVFQMTWSAGDHVVGVESIKELGDLKGKRIAVQKPGPHLGLLEDALTAAKLTWSDITPVFCETLTGDGSPADKLRKGEADAACVITPDLFGLTGGMDSVGNGAEGTVAGAHVVVSTAEMSRSIADVYAVRKDYFESNKDDVLKFFAGYLKACDDIVAEMKKYDDGKGESKKYMDTLKLAQSMYGEEILPTLEVDAHGLVLDCTFVRLPGNISFFEDTGNLNGFEKKMASSLDLATKLGFATKRFGFDSPRLDYQQVAKLAGVEYVKPEAQKARIKGEIENFTDELDDNTILSFTIHFEPNQNDFSIDTYGADFQRVLETSSTFGNAVYVVRGHSDPTQTLRSFLKAGMSKGMITRTGSSSQGYKYFLNGKELNLENTESLLKEIETINFVGAADNPKQVMQAAMNLSLNRAEAVREAIVEFAKSSGATFDSSQIQPQGVGIKEPVIPKPTSMKEAQENMRVEFRLIRVPAEALEESDFDF